MKVFESSLILLFLVAVAQSMAILNEEQNLGNKEDFNEEQNLGNKEEENRIWAGANEVLKTNRVITLASTKNENIGLGQTEVVEDEQT